MSGATTYEFGERTVQTALPWGTVHRLVETFLAADERPGEARRILSKLGLIADRDESARPESATAPSHLAPSDEDDLVPSGLVFVDGNGRGRLYRCPATGGSVRTALRPDLLDDLVRAYGSPPYPPVRQVADALGVPRPTADKVLRGLRMTRSVAEAIRIHYSKTAPKTSTHRGHRGPAREGPTGTSHTGRSGARTSPPRRGGQAGVSSGARLHPLTPDT